MVVEVRQEINDVILGQNLAIAQSAGNEILDRIKNGDHVFNKGELARRPVSARDLVIVSGVSQDKARLQQNLPTSITTTKFDLEAINKQFQELSRQSKIIGSIPGESVEVKGS